MSPCTVPADEACTSILTDDPFQQSKCENVKPYSKKQAPLRRRKKKGTESSNRPQSFNRLLQYSAVKVFVILSIIVAFTASLPTHSVNRDPTSSALESLTTESSHERGLNPIDMRIDTPTPSNGEIRGNTSEYAPPCGTNKCENDRVNEFESPTKMPSG